MTSEVENILNGQVVRKVNADKAIGVSTANLMPDEKGEVPLSKQSVFGVTPVLASQPVPEVTSPTNPVVSEQVDLSASAPVVPEVASVMPEAAPVVSEAAPALSEVAPALSEVAPALSEVAPVIPGPAPVPVAATVSDTISEAPVSVTSPTELGKIDAESIIPDIPFVTQSDENLSVTTEPEPVVPDISLPEMPKEIVAEEPKTIDDTLFVDAQTTIVPETVGIAAPVETGVPGLEAPVATETIEAPVLSAEPPVLDDAAPVVSEAAPATSDEEIVETTTETTPEVSTEATTEKESFQEPVTESIFPQVALPAIEPSTEVMDDDETKESAPKSIFPEEPKESESEVLEKLEDIFDKLCEIDEVLKEIKDKKEIIQTSAPVVDSLPQEPVVSEPVELETETQVAKPAFDIPVFEGPTLGGIQPSQDSILPPTFTQPDEMVDALGQIKEPEITDDQISLDEEQMHGKFI